MLCLSKRSSGTVADGLRDGNYDTYEECRLKELEKLTRAGKQLIPEEINVITNYCSDLEMKKIKEKGDIQLSKNAMTAKISTLESVKALDEKIDEQKALVDYLEHVESIFRYMTNDIKNVIDIMKMELS